MGSSVMSESCGGAVPQQQLCDYQAASPDEVALVKWTDMVSVFCGNCSMAYFHTVQVFSPTELRTEIDSKIVTLAKISCFQTCTQSPVP